jgi:hypothetical protein
MVVSVRWPASQGENVSESTAEVLILAINALGAGILLFVAGVVQKMMNEMDPPAFKRFMNALGRAAMTDPFAVTIATLPIIAAVAYFVAYGFHHAWFSTGLFAWMIGSSITKVSNMPVYAWVGNPKNDDPDELRKRRRILGRANNLRAWITLASVIFMACQFGVREVALVVAVALLVTPPLLWLAGRYIPR